MEVHICIMFIAALIVGTIAIISYIIYKANASSKEKCEQLKRDNPSLVRFEKDLDSNKLKRHQVCDGYLMTLHTFRTALKEFLESKALFKSSVFSTTMLNSMVSAVSNLLNKVTTYLDADLKEFVNGTQLENGMKLNMAFKHSISDIGRKMFDYPEICLRKYSCYFVDLLKMCEMINEGVKRKFSENQEVKAIAKEIDALLAEYKPISKLFDQIRTNQKEIFHKLNLRYRDKIERVEHLSEIFDNTYFLIFDDIIVFTGKFYKHMDDIKEITDKDVKKIE